MKFTYVNADNSATDSTNLEGRDEASGAGAGRDIFVKKILFGGPTDGAVTILHDAQSQPGHASGMGSVAVTEAAFKFTQATHAAGCDWVREIDFGEPGLPLNGGSIHTDDAHVTVIWEPVEK